MSSNTGWTDGAPHCINDPGIPLASIDVTNCDREPIHIPGAILPHGVMLVLDANTLEVLQAAGDTSHLLGVPLESLLGRSAAVLFRPDQVDNLQRLVAAFDLKKPRHLLDPQLRVIADQPLDASLHRSGGSLVLEFEAADPGERFAADPLSGVQEMVRGFEEQPSLLALCQLAAERVREVARYDRVHSCMTSPAGSSPRAGSRTSHPSWTCITRPPTSRSRLGPFT